MSVSAMRIILTFQTPTDKEKDIKEDTNKKTKKKFSSVTDYLCKWCLTYVGQRRQFCSADCAAQYKICQKRSKQRQDLNISVDYYGNVKLSIQGLPVASARGIKVSQRNGGGRGGQKQKRRRKRCKNCARLLGDGDEEEYCDEQCQEMDEGRGKNKKEEFLNIFQQKEAAERRRIRKWLQDAQDHYTKSVGDGVPYVDYDKGDLSDEGEYVTSGPADLNPIPVRRSPYNLDLGFRKFPKNKASQLRSGPAFPFRQERVYMPQAFRMRRDEVVTGGPVTLNPTPRRQTLQSDEQRPMDHDRRQLLIDLKWIPKFDS